MSKHYLVQIFHGMAAKSLQLRRFNLIRFDHPSKKKRHEVCIYCWNFLSLKLINIQYLNEYITLAINIRVKRGNFTFLCMSPNHCEYHFENFWNNSELTIDTISVANLFLTVCTGDFKAKFNNWYTSENNNFWRP